MESREFLRLLLRPNVAVLVCCCDWNCGVDLHAPDEHLMWSFEISP